MKDALRDVEEIRGIRKKLTRTDLYNVACLYSIASAKVPPAGTAAGQQGLAREYQEKAIKMLEKAVEAGFTDLDHMRKDPDLEPLRSLPEFQRLVDKPSASETGKSDAPSEELETPVGKGRGAALKQLPRGCEE